MSNQLEFYKTIFEPELIAEINALGHQRKVKAGEILIDTDQYIKSIPLLVSGVIKILREDENGDELLLYYLEKGDTCSMTMTCCLGDQKSDIRAIAEADTELIMVPVQKMEEWSGKYKSWRNFVFLSYNRRINELFLTIDDIAFKKMDERLVKYLSEKERIMGTKNIAITHQEIAYDMHTSRVVISRLLKKLEQLGRISLHRNHIEIINEI